MPKVDDEAIVLKLTPTGEADCVVHLLCKTRGRRSAFARGARKSRKRFVGALQPFSHIRAGFTIQRTQRLDRLDYAEVATPYLELREDLSRIALASYYCELLNVFLAEGELYPTEYALMRFFLNRLRQHPATLKHRLFFELRLLDALGFLPDVQSCAEDGSALSGAAWFDPQRQVFLGRLAAARLERAVPVCRHSREALAMIPTIPLDGLAHLRVTPVMAHEMLTVTAAVIRALSPRPLKSLALLDAELRA